MILGEQASEHLAAGGWADGESDAVILGKGFYFVKVVLKIEVLPTIGIADRNIERNV